MKLTQNQIILSVVVVCALILGIWAGKSGVSIGYSDCGCCHHWGVSWGKQECPCPTPAPKPDHKPRPIPRPGINPFETGSEGPTV